MSRLKWAFLSVVFVVGAACAARSEYLEQENILTKDAGLWIALMCIAGGLLYLALSLRGPRDK